MLGRQVAAPLLVALALAPGCSAPAKEPVVVVPGGATSPALVELLPTAAPDDAPPPEKPTRLTWQTSLETARALAKKRRLPLVVFLIAEWTVPAVKMERTTWTDPEIVALADRFIALRVDLTDDGPNAQATADHFDVLMLPTVVVLDADGVEIGRLAGFASASDVLGVLGPITGRAE